MRAGNGGGEVFLEEVLNEAVGEMGGHHGAAAFVGVGLLGAPLGFEGGILGVNPAAMDFVAQQDAGEPSIQLALQPTVRKTARLVCSKPCAHASRSRPNVFARRRVLYLSNVPQRAEMRYTLSCRRSSLIGCFAYPQS